MKGVSDKLTFWLLPLAVTRQVGDEVDSGICVDDWKLLS